MLCSACPSFQCSAFYDNFFFRKSVKNDKNVWNKETLARSLLMTCPLFFIWEIVRGDFRFLIYRDLYWNMISWIHWKMFEHIAQFLKIIIQVLSCRLQYNNPVYSFNLTRKRGVFLKIFFFTIEHLPKSLTWEDDNRN